jgi:hypothetical protein
VLKVVGGRTARLISQAESLEEGKAETVAKSNDTTNTAFDN